MEKLLPTMLSKSMIPFETSLTKSKKRQAIASAGSEALGSCWLAVGSSGSSWEVFFTENRPPEGAGHRQTMLKKKEVSFFQKINPRRELVTGKPCF